MPTIFQSPENGLNIKAHLGKRKTIPGPEFVNRTVKLEIKIIQKRAQFEFSSKKHVWGPETR